MSRTSIRVLAKYKLNKNNNQNQNTESNTYLVLMYNIQDRNNITNCYIYYSTNIILRLADQEINRFVFTFLFTFKHSLGKKTLKDRFWEGKNSQNLDDYISITSP